MLRLPTSRERFAPSSRDAPAFTADSTICSTTRLDAVASPRPCPRTIRSACASLAAGKHLFVEKPLADSGEDARELDAAADAADRRLMVGHLLRFHPGGRSARADRRGRAGRHLYLYGNRQNLGQSARRERALEPRRARRLGVLVPVATARSRPGRAASATCGRASRTSSSATSSSPPARSATCTCVARPAQDAQAHRRGLAARWSCSTTWRPTARSPSTTRGRRDRPSGRSRRAPATSRSPARPTTSRCGSSARSSPTAIREDRDRAGQRARGPGRGRGARGDAGLPGGRRASGDELAP